MTITNHLAMGAIIGVTVKEPGLALLLALASHFLMDALPHFGYKGNRGFGEALKHRLSYQVALGTLISTLFVVSLLIFKNQWFGLLAGAIAILPDALGAYNYWYYERHHKKPGKVIQTLHLKLHRAIQRYERPWGIYVEVGVFIVLIVILIKVI